MESHLTALSRFKTACNLSSTARSEGEAALEIKLRSSIQ